MRCHRRPKLRKLTRTASFVVLCCGCDQIHQACIRTSIAAQTVVRLSDQSRHTISISHRQHRLKINDGSQPSPKQLLLFILLVLFVFLLGEPQEVEEGQEREEGQARCGPRYSCCLSRHAVFRAPARSWRNRTHACSSHSGWTSHFAWSIPCTARLQPASSLGLPCAFE